MKCSQCGADNPEGSKYCGQCGMLLQKKVSFLGEKRWYFLAAIILLICVASIAIFLAVQNNQVKRYDQCLARAQRYLEQLDYEQAEAEYLQAIDFAPKEKEPYLKLYELYQKQNDFEQAVKILTNGIEQTEDESMGQQLKKVERGYRLQTYAEDVLLPQGQCETGPFVCQMSEEGDLLAPKSVENQEGVIDYHILDLDGDGEDELLTLTLCSSQSYDLFPDQEFNQIQITVFELEQEEVVPKAGYTAFKRVFGGADWEEEWLSLKTVKNTVYLIGSCWQKLSLYQQVDSNCYNQQFILYYDGSQFESVLEWVGYQGQFEEMNGSPDKLKELGWAGTTVDNMPQSCEALFHQLEEEPVDETIFAIFGENTNGSQSAGERLECIDAYERSGDPGNLGEVNVQIYLGAQADEWRKTERVRPGSQIELTEGWDQMESFLTYVGVEESDDQGGYSGDHLQIRFVDGNRRMFVIDNTGRKNLTVCSISLGDTYEEAVEKVKQQRLVLSQYNEDGQEGAADDSAYLFIHDQVVTDGVFVVTLYFDETGAISAWSLYNRPEDTTYYTEAMNVADELGMTQFETWQNEYLNVIIYYLEDYSNGYFVANPDGIPEVVLQGGSYYGRAETDIHISYGPDGLSVTEKEHTEDYEGYDLDELVRLVVENPDSCPMPAKIKMISEEEARDIAADYWDINPGDVDEDSGFTMEIITDQVPDEEDKRYCFSLKWLVNGHLSTLDSVYVDAMDGSCTPAW